MQQFIFFSLILLLSVCRIAQADAGFTVEVAGVEGELQQNILSHLSLIKHKGTLTPGDKQFEKQYQAASRETARALEPFGYYSPLITTSREVKEDTLVIVIHIDPGKPVRISQIKIELLGEGKQNPDLLAAIDSFPLIVSDLLDHRKYTAGKEDFLSAAINAGFPRALLVQNEVKVDTKKHTASISLKLDTGPVFTFGPITYICDFLNQDLIQKIAAKYEGDVFSPRSLTKIRQSLLASEYFSNVEVEYDLNHADAPKIPVTITLEPSPANQYGIGAGYGTDTGLRGTLEWYNRRFNRFGHQVEVQWQPSERKSYFGGVYTIPISDPNKDRVTVLGKWQNENFDNTETTGWTSTLGYDHLKPMGEYSVYLTFLNEDYSIGNNDNSSIILAPGLKATWRIADDRLLTGRGMSIAGTVTGGSENLFSETTFIQGSLRGKGIVSFLEKWRLIGRVEVGATAIDDFDKLPPSYRFYAGGDQSVRGYGYKRIGPTDGENNVTGGQYLLTYSAEVERRLFENWGASMFFDSGTATNSTSDLTMKNGAGVGARWNAAFGQIRIDLGVPLDDSNSWRVHFTIGADL